MHATLELATCKGVKSWATALSCDGFFGCAISPY